MRRRFVLVASMAALFVLGWWAGRGSTGDLYANLDVFVEVLKRVQENYVDPVPPSQVMDGAIKGMLKDLDPYSEYLDARDFDTLQDATRGTFHGIGVVVGVREGFPTVISPIESSPAWEAGLHSGDVIVTIDGESSSGLTVDEAAKRLRGPEGTTVRLTVRREGSEEEQDYTLTRREIVTKSVPYAFITGKDVGYVRLANFSETSGDEVREALGTLRARGARRFVLDVRMNPGGLLTEAVDVAEQFLGKGKLVVYTRGRAKNQDQRFYASEASADVQSPLVVLVDEGSASASEIVAGALQDLDRALVVGRTSFGKGSVQSVFPLRGKTAALKLTTALYYTPVGRSIHKSNGAVALDEEDAEAEDDAPAGADTVAARPLFHTSGGRVVYGGGGITPDVLVTSDTLQGLARRIEQRGLAFRFANRWINTHERPRTSAALDPVVWSAFVDYVRAQGVALDDSSLAAERGDLERAVRRELARRTAGDAAAMRIVLEGDAAFQRALAILERAGRPSDVFAFGGSAGDRSRDPAR